MSIVLRDYQQEAMDALYSYFTEKKGRNPIIAACVGAGKSILIAQLIKDTVEKWAGTRVLMLTHLAELIEQNAEELTKLYPPAEIGLFSAGLKRKDTKQNIIYAGIQSIEKHLHKFDPFNIVVIDEVHLVPKNAQTRYGRALKLLQLMNPKLVVVGYSGSPYRLDGGWLHRGEGAFFDGIAYDIDIAKLVSMGYLVPPVGKRAVNTVDMKGVRKSMGEFVASQMAQAFDHNDKASHAVKEMVEYGANRKSWMVFCASVDHAYKVTELIKGYGVDAECITGDTPKDERKQIIQRHKSGDLKCIVNVNTLTAGFNSTATDLIAIMRSTMSTALFVQMCGRGLRLHEGKENCLILDYGGNFERHGPLDDLSIRTPNSDGSGEAPAKACPNCFSICHASATECGDCGFLFPEREVKHEKTAFSGAVLKSEPQGEWLTVTGVNYVRHQKNGKPDSVRVEYNCGNLKMVKDWWCLDHGGYPSIKAVKELRSMLSGEAPTSTDQLLSDSKTLPTPHAIYVMTERKNGRKYERITQKKYARTTDMLCNLL